MNDFLVEINSEELPPKSLKKLILAFKDNICKSLDDLGLNYGEVDTFASPKRLAVRIKNLDEREADKTVEKRGPHIKAAFDEAGNPTKAALGFARSVQCDVGELERIQSDKGEYLSLTLKQAGRTVTELMIDIVNQALKVLPIDKMMRWGDKTIEFVRPVHAVVMLYGANIIEGDVLGLQTSNESFGHRFHHPQKVIIETPGDYEKVLEQAQVIASYEKRQSLIVEQVNELCVLVGGEPVYDEALLDEITSIVEWPCAIMAGFEASFLDVPEEALVMAMASHQKCIAVRNKQGQLMPHFITVANIDSQDKERVCQGNERVMRARLSDAQFFFNKDKSTPLADKVSALSHIVFQEKLGSIQDKVDRVKRVCAKVAVKESLNVEMIDRAVVLSKADLVSEMVLEFAELQGVMGEHYARIDGEADEVATALFEQYLPRYSGDRLPTSDTGYALALSDRIDTLVGIFGIEQRPTGTKDPFKLRRSALGVIRLLLERQSALTLTELIDWSVDSYNKPLANAHVKEEVKRFILDRLTVFYDSHGYSHDVVKAVLQQQHDELYDVELRLKALSNFLKSEEAGALAHAFKRVDKLLAREDVDSVHITLKSELFSEKEEEALSLSLKEQTMNLPELVKARDYQTVLNQLSHLRKAVDDFFDKVMVLTEDQAIRENRLALLSQLKNAFMQVADLSQLQ